MKLTKLPTRRMDRLVGVSFLLLLIVLTCTCIWAYRQFITTPPYVDPQRYPVKGIDVSRHNGMMNLDAAAAEGVEFIFIKASEGSDYRDENFSINYRKARHAGMKVGAYHFFRFDRDGIEQAQNILDVIGRRHLDLGIAIDVEDYTNPKDVPTTLVSDRLSRMKEYLNLKGFRVIFYSNCEGYYKYLEENFPGTPLWICSFSDNPINAEWTFWQYNHRGKVAGIRGNVDINTFCGDRKEWENFLNGGIWPYSGDNKRV